MGNEATAGEEQEGSLGGDSGSRFRAETHKTSKERQRGSRVFGGGRGGSHRNVFSYGACSLAGAPCCFRSEQEVRALFFLFFCCETSVLPRDSSGTGRFLDRPGGYAAGPSKQDVLLTVVLSRSGSSGVQLLSVHSVTTHMRVCVFFSLLCNTGQFSPAV